MSPTYQLEASRQNRPLNPRFIVLFLSFHEQIVSANQAHDCNVSMKYNTEIYFPHDFMCLFVLCNSLNHSLTTHYYCVASLAAEMVELFVFACSLVRIWNSGHLERVVYPCAASWSS